MSVGDSGWVKLWRSAMDSAVFCDRDPFIFNLFCWCVMKAAHRPDVWQGESIERGQFITGRFSAASELQVDPNKIVRGFARLTELGCIETKANSRRTLVTVCNYTTYQSSEQQNRTAGEQQVNSQRTAGEHRQEANNSTSSPSLSPNDPKAMDHERSVLPMDDPQQKHPAFRGWDPNPHADPPLDPRVVAAVREWQKFWFNFTGQNLPGQSIDCELMARKREGWTVAKLEAAVDLTIRRRAENLLDPDKDFHKSERRSGPPIKSGLPPAKSGNPQLKVSP